MISILNHWDTFVFLWVNGHHTPFADEVMLFASDKLSWIPFYLLLLWVLFKEKGKNGFWALLFAVLALVLSDQTSVHAFKFVFMRPRPCHEPALEGLVRILNNHCGGAYGFVSSHAANSFVITGFFLVLLRKPRWLHYMLWAWSFIIIYSRVYLGVHYPGDVLGGAFLGLSIGIAMAMLYREAEKKFFLKTFS